ncbi:MAG: class B sortase [Bacilli bacterium]|nr:class B sortase [Bacilli bacterium]
MKKKKRVIVFIISAMLFSFISLNNISNREKDLIENETIKEEINELVEIEDDNKIEIDFNELKKQNKDTVAYLKVNNTNIDYAIVQTNNNSYYLKHNFKKEYNTAGWLFLDYRNKLNGKDRNLIIYGHNMKNGSMMGSLKNTLKKDWYLNNDNLEITFITDKEQFKYKVFSIYQIKVEDYYIKTIFKSDKDYMKFLNTLKNRSIYNFDIQLNKDDKILTLSTCAKGHSERIVLHAKLIK